MPKGSRNWSPGLRMPWKWPKRVRTPSESAGILVTQENKPATAKSVAAPRHTQAKFMGGRFHSGE